MGYRRYVSNPWREAIEARNEEEGEKPVVVSNPWREAIEEAAVTFSNKFQKSFQSLEGGY